MGRTACLSALFLLTVILNVRAQEERENKGSFHSILFLDYYWFAQSHNTDFTDKNGFLFLRIYLTYDRRVNDHLSARLRFDTKSPGDFSSDTKLRPYVKDAYLNWSSGNQQIRLGISPTPTFDLQEDIWKYRSVAKSPLNLFKFGSSRNLGISAKVKLGGSTTLEYHFFLGNGNGGKPELNSGKKLMLSVSYWLTDHFVIDGYADWKNISGEPAAVDYYTLKGFAAYQSENFSIGGLYAFQQYNASAETAKGLNLVSLFGNYTFSQGLRTFVQASMMLDPNPRAQDISYLPMSSAAPATFIVGGIDIRLYESLFLQPNLEAVLYGEDESGLRPQSDILPRLTVVFSF